MTDADLRAKVDELLRQALETEGATRTRLIGKAAYWNQVATKYAAKAENVVGREARARFY